MSVHLAKSIKAALFASPLLLATSLSFAADTLIDPWTSSWKYLDNGSDQGSSWTSPSYDDSSWASGLAQLGYGDGDEATVVNSGPLNNYFVTTYFRHTFNVANSNAYQSINIQTLRDDGIVVYLNGSEIWRDNMPTGALAYNTLASSAISGTGETTPVSITLPSTALQTGSNTIAVEIHQSAVTSSDITFALQLTADSTPPPNPNVSRGPYLQMLSPTSAVIRWRTPVANDTKVNYGTTSGSLTNTVTSASVTTEHEIQITGLTPATTYYYNIGTTTTVLSSGADHFFKTQPVVGTKAPTRIWVIGDSGRNNQSQRDVYQGYRTYAGSTYADLWLMLGDNAYSSGTDAEYQAGLFDIYGTVLHQTVVWPTLGNHDGCSANTPAQTGPYYDNFTLPKFAELGGVASNTESYYSYNYGNIHFIVLDSFDADRSVIGAMATWLTADLNATTADWIIAYWHHPPYSKGSHDSDTSDGDDSSLSSTGISSLNAMLQMRSNILPILEAHGVDLVLCGHSHSYERSKFVDGHYGLSSSYSDVLYAIDTGSGDPASGGKAYTKVYPSIPHGGTVYTVAGTSGTADGGALNHPVMYRSMSQLGSMVIDIDNLDLSAKFIDQTGTVRDSFTLRKRRSVHADKDRDGDSDVLVRATSTGAWTSYSVQNGAIIGNASLNIPVSSDTKFVAQLDTNGDGDADVLTRSVSTGAWTLYQIQNGAVAASGPLYLYANLGYQFVGTGDFNNDGTDDVLLRDATQGYRAFLLQNNAVSSVVYFNAWTAASSVDQGIGDFNGDGTDDLLVRRTSDNLYFVFKVINGAVNSYYCACNIWNNPDWTFQFAGDTNKDGIDDIVIRGTGASADGKWWAFRMNNFISTYTTNLNLFINKTAVTLGAVGDYNGDGTIDVLTRVNNSTTYVSPLDNGLVTGNNWLQGFTSDQLLLK